MGFIKLKIFDKDCALVICIGFMVLSAMINTVQCVYRRKNCPAQVPIPLRQISRPYNAGAGSLPIVASSEEGSTSNDAWNQQWPNATGQYNCKFKTFLH